MNIKEKYEEILFGYVGIHDRDELIEELLNLHSVICCDDTDNEDTTEYINKDSCNSLLHYVLMGVVLCGVAAFVGYIIFKTIKSSFI